LVSSAAFFEFWIQLAHVHPISSLVWIPLVAGLINVSKLALESNALQVQRTDAAASLQR
jgi:hypothetical protein